MTIVSLKFATTNKIYDYQLSHQTDDFQEGESVLVEDQGVIEPVLVVGVYQKKDRSVPVQLNQEGTGKILRRVTPKDQEKIDKLKAYARDYLPLCQEKIKQYGLNAIRLLDADISFDGKKLTFYFSAEGRIDFRELVTDLVKSFHKIIRLQQIGSREEARLFGGFGRCGRSLCCAGFLKKCPNITLDMAKEQDLLSSSSKLSGACGKLLCCLSYERDIYREMSKNMPEMGQTIKTGGHKGKVVSRNILKRTVVLKTDEGKTAEIEVK